MPFQLTADAYGKAQNRLMRVVRETDRHEIRDVTIGVQLRGDFAPVFLEGDNTDIPATDTMKNTVFGMARTDFTTGSIEDFGKALVTHLVGNSDRVASAEIHLVEHPWVRLAPGGVEHDHAFHRGSSGDHDAWVTGDGDSFTVKAGISDLFVLRSTGSGFKGFERDRFTTLPEVDDRILATVVTATWTYGAQVADYQATWQGIHDTLIARFADHYSDSVQQTIYNICTAILEGFPEITEVSMTLPNKHHNLVDLSPFGLDNPGVVFIATQDPFGLINGTVTRT